MLNIGEILNGKQLTLSSGAWLLVRYPDSSQWNPEEYNMVHSTVTGALEQLQALPCIPDIHTPRGDSRSPAVTMQTVPSPLKVFTDYDDARRHIDAALFLRAVDSAEDADFLLVLKQISNFLKTPINQFVAQYPYEGGFVRKDLLPLTVRKCCYKDGEPPSWWLPCFDVSTEFHLLYREYNRRKSGGEPNWWILKPGQGCRGQGHKIFFSRARDHCSLEDLSAHCSPFDSDGSSDKVAQLLVQNPMLVLGRKFDLRLFVVVRSFSPFEAYVHNNFYARLANKPYSTAELDSSEVAITVNAYDKDEDIAAKQERLKFDELRNMLLHEVWGLSAGDEGTERYRAGLAWWDGVVQSVYQCLRELFRGVAPTVGVWPLSRAYYAVDVMLDAGGDADAVAIGDLSLESTAPPPPPPDAVSAPTPKLMEVNYMGDWGGMEGGLRVRDPFAEIPGYVNVVPPSFPEHTFDDWCQDLLRALMTIQELDTSSIFTRL